MKRDIRILPAMIVLAFITTGCAKKMMGPPPPPPPETILGASENDGLQYSLFKGDQNVLSIRISPGFLALSSIFLTAIAWQS
jgi:hypothetical protein